MHEVKAGNQSAGNIAYDIAETDAIGNVKRSILDLCGSILMDWTPMATKVYHSRSET